MTRPAGTFAIKKIKYEKNIVNAGHFIIHGPEYFRAEIRNF